MGDWALLLFFLNGVRVGGESTRPVPPGRIQAAQVEQGRRKHLNNMFLHMAHTSVQVRTYIFIVNE